MDQGKPSAVRTSIQAGRGDGGWRAQPHLAASAALAWTERLHVGVGLLPVPLRNVALATMEIAMLNLLFPGRITVGVGHGVQDWMDEPDPEGFVRFVAEEIRPLVP